MNKLDRFLRLGGAAAALSALTVPVAATPSPTNDGTPTYHRDVAPIIFDKCMSCHRDGQIAPFVLTTYQDVRRRGRQISEVVADRYMPPWLPSGEMKFRDERRLSDEQVRVIQQWYEGGMPEGDAADSPEVPTFADGWALGKPDLVLTMQEPYEVAADGVDIFRNFVIPIELEGERWVEAVDFQYDNYRVVHHARITIDPTRTSRRLALEDPVPGFDGMVEGTTINPDGHFLGWTPGRVPARSDTAWRINSSLDVVLQLHLLPTGKPENVTATIGLYFRDDEPTTKAASIDLGVKYIHLEPGQTDFVAQDEFVVPADVRLLGIYPHAHYLGKTIQAYAEFPDGTQQTLIEIDDWDFNWQDEYLLLEPLTLPRGTRLWMEIAYDNSAANVRNPNDPPELVVYGPRSSDEMGNVILQVVADSEYKWRDLAQALGRKMAKSDVRDFRKTLEKFPDDADVLNYLGARYQMLGALDSAREAIERSLQIDPTNNETLYNLSVVDCQQERWEDAIEHIKASLAQRPERTKGHYSPDAQFNLGVAYRELKRVDEAIAAFEAALDIRPEFAEAHNNLGMLRVQAGDLERAAEHFQQAIRINPRYDLAFYNLGDLFERQGKPEKAVRQFKKALRINPRMQRAELRLQRLRSKGK